MGFFQQRRKPKKVLEVKRVPQGQLVQEFQRGKVTARVWLNENWRRKGYAKVEFVVKVNELRTSDLFYEKELRQLIKVASQAKAWCFDGERAQEPTEKVIPALKKRFALRRLARRNRERLVQQFSHGSVVTQVWWFHGQRRGPEYKVSFRHLFEDGGTGASFYPEDIDDVTWGAMEASNLIADLQAPEQFQSHEVQRLSRSIWKRTLSPRTKRMLEREFEPYIRLFWRVIVLAPFIAAFALWALSILVDIRRYGLH